MKEHANVKRPALRLQTPRPQHWYDVSVGSSEAHIALTLNSQKNLLSCELYISKNKELFFSLLSEKERIESEIGGSLEWKEAAVAARIILRKPVPSVFDENRSEEHFEWLESKAELFQKVFRERLSKYKNGE